MMFDTASKNIILVSYPSGGFGNFIYQILIAFAQETIKPDTIEFNFSPIGDSHNIKKLTHTYFHNPTKYDPWITVDFTNKIIPVLCDNGIDDQYQHLSRVFPNAKIIRMVIDKNIRPVLYQTCIIKAKKSSLLKENVDKISQGWDGWNSTEDDYPIRENFTLLYYNWPFGDTWDYADDVVNVSLENLIIDPYQTIVELLSSLNLTLINPDMLTTVLNDWYLANEQYFKVYVNANHIMQALDTNQNIDLTDITDMHEQGYINYCIETKYHVTIPVYDYKDWFASTNEIIEMIEKLHV